MKTIEVYGKYACFTRPELSVERVTYDIITPSAARNIYQSIFWKPKINWQISKIEILNPIKHAYLKRNEVSSTSKNSIYIEDNRCQKGSIILKDVRYRITADLIYNGELTKKENPGKYIGMFDKRASKGACFKQPYLGCREFSCNFKFIENLNNLDEPINLTTNLGLMFYDYNYEDKSRLFFEAKVQNGVMNIPEKNSDKIYKKAN